jgi:chaperonin cofactor prefoldin
MKLIKKEKKQVLETINQKHESTKNGVSKSQKETSTRTSRIQWIRSRK